MNQTNKKAMAGAATNSPATKTNSRDYTDQQTGQLVQTLGDAMWTTSVLVADRFEKRHDNVLQAIAKLNCSEAFRRLNFEERDYIDERGKTQPGYRITRDGFSMLGMGFTGQKAGIWKERFIEAFGMMERELRRIARQKSDPSRQFAIKEKRGAANLLTDCLVESRSEQGKETKDHHFRNEHSLCNWVLTGSFEPLNEDDLTKQDAKKLSDIRRRDAVLLLKGLSYAKRKAQLNTEFPILPGTDRLTAANDYRLEAA